MSSPQFSRPGAIDLSGLAPATTPAPGTAGRSAYAVDLTTADQIGEIAEASLQHVVILSLWSPRSPASVEVNDLLARLADAYAGRFLLARVDVDALPQVAQAVGAQGVPFAVALLRGQPVAQVPPTLDEAELRQVLDSLVEAAVSNGVTGRVAPQPAGLPANDPTDEPVDDPRFAEADASLAAGDFDAALAAYDRLLAANPVDIEARERRAGVALMARTSGQDIAAALAAAEADPDDVDAQLLGADVDVVAGRAEKAFGRLIETVRRTADADRERVRTRLLELFEVVGVDDPRVGTARRNLSSALF
ncbi:MAG: co-chaperone YbbN [Nocardioidaceae bacterium]